MKIEKAYKKDYQTLIEIWEASVRATHDFLKEEDLMEIKPLLLNKYFDFVNLECAKDKTGRILGFCGVYEDKIEMLFIDPAQRGKGIGTSLTKNAIKHQNITKVDVNEQNDQALKFYEHIGFKVTDRSPLDSDGRPYPILHMELK